MGNRKSCSAMAATRKRSPDLKNGKRVGDNFCLDIFDSGEDCRWCVRAKSRDLDGVWDRSRGRAGDGRTGARVLVCSPFGPKSAPDK